MRCGKLACATVVGCDISDLESYQPTRLRGVFTNGTNYYTSKKAGQKIRGGGWSIMDAAWFTEKYQIVVYAALYAPEVQP